MSIASRTLKPEELGNLERAKEAANSMQYHQWIQWMRANFTYSESVRMCTFIGIKMPSHGFYNQIKRYNREVAA